MVMEKCGFCGQPLTTTHVCDINNMSDTKKQEGVIAIDLAIIPNGMALSELVYYMKELNILFYDGAKCKRDHGYSTKPFVVNGRSDKLLIDIATKGGKRMYEEIKKKLGLKEQ